MEDYDGTIVAVSHDRYFINRVADYIYAMEDGKITGYIGNYDDYAAKLAEAEKALEEPRPEETMTKTALQKLQKKEKQNVKEQRARKAQIRNLEDEIEDLEQQKAELEERLSDGELYKDASAKDVLAQYEAVKTQIEEKMAQWEELLSEE